MQSIADRVKAFYQDVLSADPKHRSGFGETITHGASHALSRAASSNGQTRKTGISRRN